MQSSLQRGHFGLGIYVGDMSSTECKGPARMSTRDDPCQLSSGRVRGEIDLHSAVTSTHHVEVDSKRSSILPQDRIIGLGDAYGTEPSFLGGIRLGGYNATIPLVRLTLLPDRATTPVQHPSAEEPRPRLGDPIRRRW